MKMRLQFLTKKGELLSKLLSIRVKLFVGLMVPVILLAVYGWISYHRSEEALITNYETNSLETLNAISDYLDFGLNMVEEKTAEYIFDSEIGSYFNKNSSDGEFEYLNQQSNIRNKILMALKANSFISGIHLVGENRNSISTATSFSDTMYSTFINTKEAKNLENNKIKSIWIGKHTELDKELVTNSTTYTTDDYALSYLHKMNADMGYVIIDISRQQILDMFDRYHMGENSIIGLVNDDGSEVLTGTEEIRIFNNLSYYHTAMKGEKDNGYFYEEYNHINYLFLYDKISDANVSVCALIPRDTIIEQVEGIKALNITFVSAACIFAAVTIIFIAGGISRGIGSLMKSIAQASKGDLTTRFDTKRKDEFKALSDGIAHMMESMRNLIGEVQEVGGKVSISADGLSNTSEELLVATKGISHTIDDIEKGIVQQADDTEHCLLQMSGLSEQIGQVYKNTNEIEQIAGTTKYIAGEGIVLIDELNDKSKATYEVTQEVIKKIEEFEVQSRSISEFVKVIVEIAAQTNLLSLNASIEAARAGEAGRGFSVVATEIRKLAEQSVQAVKQIEGIVSGIQAKTKDTVLTAKQAEGIVESQTEALDRTVKAFNNINHHVNDLVNNLNNISKGIKLIEDAKEDTLDAIQNISAVSEETAAASEEVSATAINQIDAVERLRIAASELADNAKILEEGIKQFKIEEGSNQRK